MSDIQSKILYNFWLKNVAFPQFIWPKSDKHGRHYILNDAQHIPQFMQYLRRRNVCVQAGGNVGVYPMHLACYFNKVHTFEPNPENYACLSENIQSVRKIVPHPFALGERVSQVGIENHEEGNAGALHVTDGGCIPMIAIDDMNLDECDLIWLDIEGYEEPALRGAVRTVESHRPAVIIEENGFATMHGLAAQGAANWLKARGYAQIAKRGNDCLYVYSSQTIRKPEQSSKS